MGLRSDLGLKIFLGPGPRLNAARRVTSRILTSVPREDLFLYRLLYTRLLHYVDHVQR